MFPNTFQKLFAVFLIFATASLYANTPNGQETFRTNITALSTEMNRLITFTVKGTDLIDHKGLTIGNCTPSNAQPSQTLSQQNVFQCTQNRVSRANKGLIKNVPGDLRLYELLAEQNDTQTPIVVVAPLCEETTYINDYCRNPPDKILSNVQIGQNASINGGQFQGHITNQGWISNVTLLPGATLTGGILTGYIINQGTIADSDFRGASITGGTLAGLILNNSQIGGQFINVNLAPNTLIRGGILKGEIKGDCNAPARLENLTVTAHSKLICVTITDTVILETGITIEKIQNDKPLTIRLDQFSPSVTNRGNPTVFTITGDNLPEGMGFSVDNCLPSNHELPGGTQTQRQFQCTISGEAGLKKGKITFPKTTEILYPFQVQVNAPHPVSRQVTLDHQFNMQIPSLIYKKATGDRYLWTELKLTPTEHNSPLRFEILEYGDYTDTIEPTEESVILTDDLHLTIPRVTFLDAAGQQTDYWGELQLKANDDGKLFFEVQASGGFITMTGTVHDPLTGATVELYDNNGNLLKKQEHTTDTAGQFTLSLPDKKTTNYIKVYGGTLNGQPFQGELIGPCPSTGATTLSCHISPFSSLLMRLSALYPKNGVQQAQQHLAEVLGLTADPFLSPETRQVNLPLWRENIAQGAGLAFQLDHISSDIVDGYLDDEQAQQFLIGAKKRPVITETVAIDQSHLEQQLVENPIILKGTLKVMSFSDANDLKGTENEVKHEDYLSGYAAVVERTTEETENPVSTEIVYNAFNVGRWKGQLNAETTTLYQIFMTEPDLLFLPRSEQKRIAEKLAAQDEFAQATQLYEAELQFSESAAPDTRAFLIADLAESGITLLSESQTSGARRLLQTRVVTAKNTLQRRANRSSNSPILLLPLNGKEMFTIFDGMRVVPRLTTGNVLNLEFYSNLSLWYALFDRHDFSKTETPWYSHVLDAPLITPKANWIDFETVTDLPTLDRNAKRTRMPVANIVGGELKEVNNEADWVIYRNNPNAFLDAPQLMNTLSAVNVVLEAASGLNILKHVQKGFQKSIGITKIWESSAKLYESLRHIKPFLQASWEIAKDMCDNQTFQEIFPVFEDMDVTACNQRFGNLEALKGLIDAWPDPLPGDSKLSVSVSESQTYSVDGSLEIKLTPGEVEHSLYELKNALAAFRKTTSLAALKKYAVVLPPKAEIKTILVEGILKIAVIPYITHKAQAKVKNITPLLSLSGNQLFYEGKPLSSREMATAILNRKNATKKQKDIVGALKIVMAGKTLDNVFFIKDIGQILSATAIIAKFHHNLINLRESVINADTSDVMQLIYLISAELLRSGNELIKESAAEMLRNAILNFTPAKVVKILASAGQGSAMAWDWMTAPSVINLQAVRKNVACPSKTDSTSTECIIFSTRPKLEAVRYLSVKQDWRESWLQVHGLAGAIKKSKKTEQWVFPTNAIKDANHLLVISGFAASVENHAIFAPKDEETFKTLMDKNAVTTDWHVYRFKQLPDTEALPRHRNASNAFNNNYFTCDTRPNFCVKNTSTYKKGGNNELLNKFMNSQPELVDKGIIFADSIEYIDFTQVYGKGLLTHQTPGVYSDTTRFYVGGKEGDVYANTFNVYVLPNYKKGDIDKTLKQQSRLLTDGEQKLLHLKLVRGDDNYWGKIKNYPFYVIIWSDIDGKIRCIGPQKIYLNVDNGAVVPLASDIPIEKTEVYVYDVILETWRQKTGNNLIDRFSYDVSQYSKKPFMSFLLAELQIEEGEVEIKDTDGDGVADENDLWKDDPRYAADSDQDGLADNWEKKYGFSHFSTSVSNNANDDPDKDSYTNLYEFEKTLALGTEKEGYNPNKAAPVAVNASTSLKVDEEIQYEPISEDEKTRWNTLAVQVVKQPKHSIVTESGKTELTIKANPDAPVGAEDSFSYVVVADTGESSLEGIITLEYLPKTTTSPTVTESVIKLVNSGFKAHFGISDADMSADGCWVAFTTQDKFLGVDENNSTDAYVRNMCDQNSQAFLVTWGLDKNGKQIPAGSINNKLAISGDGRYVAFSTGQDSVDRIATGSEIKYGYQQVFIRDIVANKTLFVSVNEEGEAGMGASYRPSISDDGNIVVFRSNAKNLDSDYPTGGGTRIYVRNISENTTKLVSLGRNKNGILQQTNAYEPVISGNGLFVAFKSDNSDLLNLTGHELSTSSMTRQIFLRNLQAETTELISVGINGKTANKNTYSPAISADGNFVAFSSDATNLVDYKVNSKRHIYVRSRVQPVGTVLIDSDSQGNPANQNSTDSFGAINTNWRNIDFASGSDYPLLVFPSEATNLTTEPITTTNTSNIFLHNMATGDNMVISRAQDELGNWVTANWKSFRPVIADNGKAVMFMSAANNLTPLSQPSMNVYWWEHQIENEIEVENEEITTKISAGNNHTCILRKDGSVDCWGSNYYGESTPPSGSFIQISAGQSRTCGIRTNGRLECWGNNYYNEPTLLSGSFTQVSVGSYHICAILKNGSVECWGRNEYGESTPPPGSFTQISTGYSHTCGILKNGNLECWGRNKYIQDTPLSGNFIQISVSDMHSCALSTEGNVACWGENHSGGTMPPSGSFTQISAASCALRIDGSVDCWGWPYYENLTRPSGSFVQISLGQGHICGLRKDGSVACWGDNDLGQSTLASDRFTELSTNSHICAIRKEGSVACWGDNGIEQATPPSDDHFTQISTGSSHTCGIRKDNSVECWGDNDSGQASPPSSKFTQVSAGFRHTCGIRKDENLDDNVECWGYNNYEKAISPSGRFTQISAGFRQTCGILENESVKCWGGYNEYGKATPLPGRFTQVSAGGSGSHTCGIRTDGSVACWGYDKDRRTTPPSGYFTQVSAGGGHTCGIRTDGSVACWGYNDEGQATPPSGNFSKVSAGGRYTCALRKDGIMLCWGSIARNISQDDFPTE